MQLTRYTDFGIRILMYLAVQPERESLFRIAEVTCVFDLSSNHVAKIIHQLGRLGYLQTVRGKNGGFRLAKTAAELNLGQLVRNLEHSLAPIDCESPYCRFSPICKLKGVLAQAVAAYLAVLDNYTLADIVDNKEDILATLPDLSISVLQLD